MANLFFKDKNFYKNVDVIRCYVSKNYNKVLLVDFGLIFLLFFPVFMQEHLKQVINMT